jgi:hypothetical protein
MLLNGGWHIEFVGIQLHKNSKTKQQAMSKDCKLKTDTKWRKIKKKRWIFTLLKSIKQLKKNLPSLNDWNQGYDSLNTKRLEALIQFLTSLCLSLTNVYSFHFHSQHKSSASQSCLKLCVRWLKDEFIVLNKWKMMILSVLVPLVRSSSCLFLPALLQ